MERAVQKSYRQHHCTTSLVYLVLSRLNELIASTETRLVGETENGCHGWTGRRSAGVEASAYPKAASAPLAML